MRLLNILERNIRDGTKLNPNDQVNQLVLHIHSHFNQFHSVGGKACPMNLSVGHCVWTKPHKTLYDLIMIRFKNNHAIAFDVNVQKCKVTGDLNSHD